MIDGMAGYVVMNCALFSALIGLVGLCIDEEPSNAFIINCIVFSAMTSLAIFG